MDIFLCLPLLALFLQPALCVYNCSTMYKRTPDNSDLTIECGTTMITIEVNLCTALWAGFNSSALALSGNHNNSACLGSIDESVEPPIIRYHLPVNSSVDNSCRQSLQIVDETPDPSGPFSSFSSIQTVIISSYIDTPKTEAGIISYSTDLYYYFSCRYPLEYLINNTQIVASSVSVATTNNNGSFIDTLKMGVFNDTDYRYPLMVPSTGLQLRTKVYVEVKAVNLTGNFHVLLDHCFATPSPYNMTQRDQYNFFTGCQVSSRTSITSNGLSNVAKFNFEAFRFVQHKDQEKSTIYLHCILRLCEPNKCQELLNACNARRKRSLTPFGEESSNSATVSVGPLYTAATEPDVPEAAGSTANMVASGSAGVDASSLVVWLMLGSVVGSLLPDTATGLP
ncbi:zona pellucida-like domain-containing protein 1 [Poeciliopsis prolifica]|uniref:zona pellucida-like domain-containing protein 1 n=1 Tax=Poeciliopsis prolifica TaxID=188132 RepID=UPI0024133DA2|nr:zona pellucida-like domain-containing protein 1 [Poeciliopsis prolifica]